MKILLFVFLILAWFGQGCLARQPASGLDVLSHVERELPHEGTLRQVGCFVYVDLDDGYIHQLIRLISEEGFEEPPYFEPTEKAASIGSHIIGVGAHISVMYPDEISEDTVIEEAGEVVSFGPVRCHVVRPPRSGRMGIADEAYVLVVDAPRIRQIREKYGLTPEGHKLHITIAVR
jgi:Swiss Army Knife, 2H phosphoesterase domain